MSEHINNTTKPAITPKTDSDKTQPQHPTTDTRDDAEDYSAMGMAVLPLKDDELPPIIREIVTNAPQSRKIPSFVASLAPLCALASRVRAKYYHDTTRLHALLLQVVIEGAQSSGKSFAADIESLIMDDTLKARDKAQRRLEQEYREKKKRRSQNKQLEEEPQTTIRVIPPTISKTVLTKRADFYERILGDTMTFWMFAEELAQVTDAGKAGYSNLRTIMRTAYDLGSLFGIDYASDNSYSAIVDINICSMFCATPAALDEYYDRKAIEGGNITRCIICPLSDSIESDGEMFLPYSDTQTKVIRETLGKMMADNYDASDHLRPTMLLDMKWIDDDCKAFIQRKAREYSLSGSEAVKVFRKRASVSAFRIACLCYYLYALDGVFDPTVMDDGNVLRLRAQKLCKMIYGFMSEYIISQMLRRWGKTFNDLNSKRVVDTPTDDKNLFDMLTPEFTRDQLNLLVKQIGCTTPVRQFIWMWGPRKMNIIEPIDKNHFRKKDLKND